MKTHRILATLLIASLFIILITSCEKGSDVGAKPEDEIPSKSDAPAAIVNGTVISMADLETAIQNVALGMGQAQTPKDELMGSFASRVLGQLITGELLYQEAVREGFVASAEDIDKAFTDISSQYSKPEEFQAEIKKRGYDEETLRKNISRQFTIQQFIVETIASKVNVTEAEAREFYDQNPDNFITPEQVRASHILIKSSESDDEKTREEAGKKALELAATARKGETDFSELAREHSEGPSGPNGGDLGFFQRGGMLKPFSDAAFSMKKGEISNPVLTTYGYHVIKVTDRKEKSTVPFDEVSERLIATIRNGRINEQVGNKVSELSSRAEVEIKIQQPSPPEQSTPQ
ncbi:MAG: peptidylprolyl isomerase [bacterium]